MNDKQPTYRELEIEVQEAREQIATLYRHEADAIVGSHGVSLVRTREIEKKLEEARRKLEQQYTGQSEELRKAKDNLREGLDQNAKMARELEKGQQALRQKADELRKLSLQLGEAEDRERRRLAAILHDDIQQLMAGAKFRLEVMGRSVDERGKKLYESSLAVLLEAIEKTRDLSHELNPPILLPLGLVPALQELADKTSALHRLSIECDLQTDRQPEDEQVRGFAFRAVKELFFNITKHADTSQARMEIRSEDHFLVIVVTDRGRGFDVAKVMADKESGLGLSEIRRRAGAPGQGSRFTLRVPLHRVEGK